MTSAPASGVPSHGELVLSDAAFREIVEQSLVGKLLVDNERVVYANAASARIFDRPIEQLIGMQLDQLVYPDDRGSGNERMRQRIAGMALTAPYAIRALRPDGSIRDLETLTSLVTIEGRRLVLIAILDATERNLTRRILNQMAEAIGSKVGDEFFSSLVLNLAHNLEVDYAFVGELSEDQKSLRMIALTVDRAPATPITYPISGTPCEAILAGSLCWYPKDVQVRYPQDRGLVEQGIHGYAGIPLKDWKGRSIGLLSIMNRGELPQEHSGEAALEVYAVRAAAELQRRLAERELLAAKSYLDNLIETANVLIVELDLHGTVTRVNKMTEEITGYSREELMGKSWFDRLMPERRRHHAAIYLQNLQQGNVLRVNESPIVRSDGSERIMAWRNSAIRNSEGAVVGSVSFGVDVTERKRGETERDRLQHALAGVADEWRRTFNAVNTPIMITQEDGEVVRVNRAACELSGLLEEEIVGRNVAEVQAGEPWQTAAQMVKYIADERAGTSAETRDDLGRTWDITIAHFPVEPDRAERYILVFWNITGIVELQESLRRSETMSAMGTLLAGVAHEVRNPLFGISAALDAYAVELRKPGYVEFASALRSEVVRLTQLMQDLLEFGKPSASHVERGSLREVIQEAIQNRAPAGITIENAVPADLPTLLMDRGRLSQVFENLIDNAAQISPEGSVVHVGATIVEHLGQKWIECRVEDNGPGFALEDLERAFEPFFTRREGGTGLGLSIVQRIVQDHAGRVYAENHAGGGARIRILLPIARHSILMP